MAKSFISGASIFFFSLGVLLYGCSPTAPAAKETTVLYRAIAKTDTADLKIIYSGNAFYGQMEINYGGSYKDSGDVNGVVKGDTLKGTYYFQHYGIELKQRIPISMLKKNKILILGVGEMEIYMNMTFFKKTVPIDYRHTKFTFEQIK
jgi:hypothetical protein